MTSLRSQWKPKTYWTHHHHFGCYSSVITPFLYKFATAAKLTNTAADLVLSHSLNLYVLHAIKTLPLTENTQHFSA